MKGKHRWMVSRLSLVGLLLCGSLGPVSAKEGTPPVPYGSSAAGPAAPAAVSATCVGGVLYCQLDNPGTDFVSSQDFTFDSQDATAADDFIISPAFGVKSWEISAITVDGQHFPGGTTSATNPVYVKFYADNGQGRPGTMLFAPAATIQGGTLDSGDFTLNLNPPVQLAADGHYWVSVQAVKPVDEPPPQWMWVERTIQSNSPAVWQNPGNGFLTACVTWTPLSTCYPPVGPDLLFSVIGASSSVTATTPILVRISPPGGLDEDVPLSLTGHNFLPGAVISWTVDSDPTPFTVAATFVSSTALTALIPAAEVTPEGGQAQVVVVNPGPCYGLCTSGPLIFALKDLQNVYLPLIRR